MPRVSIIIPAYNAAAYLFDALASVFNQTYPNWEILVADDGSTDDTRALVTSVMSAFGGRLHYFYQANAGQAAARNAAMRKASGEFIALLDADDAWLEDRLELGVAVMEAQPEVGLVHGKAARINAAGEIIEYPPCPSPRFQRGRIARYIYTRRAHLLCPTILFRKACLEAVGCFDETMCPCEDRDLWFRIAERHPVEYIEEVVALYRILPNSSSRNWKRASDSQRRFIEKHRRQGSVGGWAARMALGNLYRERGDAIFHTGDIRASLTWYGKALGIFPFNASNVYMFFRAAAEFPIRRRVPRSQRTT